MGEEDLQSADHQRIAGFIVLAFVVASILLFLQVPLCGIGPTISKRLWTRIVRFFKRGDVRPWTWHAIEEGVVYLSSLPRHIDEVTALQASPFSPLYSRYRS